MRFIFYNLLLIILCLFSTGITSEEDTYIDLTSKHNIISFFNDNLDEMKDSYEETYGVSWNATRIKYCTDVYNFQDVKVGDLVVFDIGYVAFGTNYELLSISNDYVLDYLGQERVYCDGTQLYMKKNENFYSFDGVRWSEDAIGMSQFQSDIVYELSSQINKNDFKISSCCTRISYLSDKFKNFNFGNYKIASVYQGGTTDCGVIAIMNLIYSYYFSNIADFTHSKTSNEMREELRELTKWQENIVGEGLLPGDLVTGCNKYINEKNIKLETLENGDFDDDVFGIALYMNFNVANTAHYALKVGTASQKKWWIFRTYWDIVATWDSNLWYNNGYPYKINDNDCFYVIDQKFRRVEYQLYRGAEIIK